ncbi:MAG TPA: hypothetical protein V6C65_03010 [Allocoleopsis sp.]
MSSLIRSPLPPLVSDAHFYISGNVTVHPSAAIAPGVMLQADPESHLVIAAGVCIGVGCILHAYQGTLEVDAGATLGSGVLVVGQGKIGANACIGAMTTILNSSIPAKEIIEPGSLIGDHSRRVVIVEASEPSPEPSPESSPPDFAATAQPAPAPEPIAPPSEPPAAAKPDPASKPESASESVRVVYGQSYLQRMMITMFPHRTALNQDQPDAPPDGS